MIKILFLHKPLQLANRNKWLNALQWITPFQAIAISYSQQLRNKKSNRVLMKLANKETTLLKMGLFPCQ